MKWYKYTENQFADMFSNQGRIRLNSLDYYRDVERHGRAIGDAHENTRSIESFADNLTARQLNPFQRSFISFDERTFDLDTNRFIGCKFIQRHVGRPTYAICLSDVFDLAIPARINIENLEANRPQYDACVEVSDHLEFIRLLSKAASEEAGLKVYGYGSCFYRTRTISWEHWNPRREQCPAFIKPPEYAWQKEVRVLFSAEDVNIKGPIDLVIPDLSRICTYYPINPFSLDGLMSSVALV